ncbi:MAG: hypothetical protein OEM28_04605 [Nitrosopumilus sp.]|nr:hypothetical protein [Nitrosopumilus sp.]MDH3486671.1 hypothetical protein [Nitrosopumilus sp.]
MVIKRTALTKTRKTVKKAGVVKIKTTAKKTTPIKKKTTVKKTIPLDTEHVRSAAFKKGWITQRKNAKNKK